jgi:hypothetical protein
MPLKQGSDRKTIASNISEMEDNGHPHDVAVAAALNTAHPEGGKKKKKKSETMTKSIAALIIPDPVRRALFIPKRKEIS